MYVPTKLLAVGAVAVGIGLASARKLRRKVPKYVLHVYDHCPFCVRVRLGTSRDGRARAARRRRAPPTAASSSPSMVKRGQEESTFSPGVVRYNDYMRGGLLETPFSERAVKIKGGPKSFIIKASPAQQPPLQ